MRILFLPKHQKLVNQCYPPGRTPDKKSKSSETSYLLYYVNSRRTKLEKVSVYLVKRTISDLNRKRIGNVCVTLELMNKIIIHCKENLNIFVKDFLNIMMLTLNNNNFNNDIIVIEKIEEAFDSMCTFLDGALSNGDLEFIHMYQSFVKLYFNVVEERIHNDDLLLKCCLDISKLVTLASNPQVKYLIMQCVTICLDKFQERHPRYNGINLERELQQDVVTRNLSRTQTRTLGLELTDKSSDYSILSIQSYFNTTETDKITLSIRALLKKLIQIPNKHLLQYICNVIPVQLRYVVVLLSINQLTTDQDHAVVILKLVSTLLLSEVSIIGLSVLDIMRKILNFQLMNSNSQEIIDQCIITIKDLNKKAYYKNQTSDMFTEILIRLKDEKIVSKEILINDLQDLISSVTGPCFELDLFLELSPYTTDYKRLFSLINESIPDAFSIDKFFYFIGKLTSTDTQRLLIHECFVKYKGFALLSGLKFYSEEFNQPSFVYYAYHLESAKFLNFDNYRSQTEYKKSNNELFTSDDLINYYSDVGSNKFSEKGKKILLRHTAYISTTDLLSETHTIIPSVPATHTPGLTESKILRDQSSFDATSLRSLKYSSPKVKDLKGIFRQAPNHTAKWNGTLYGSQSVKSKITNITFLLSELNHDTNENNIYDPDEEEIIGMEKSDLAKSQSIKLSIANNKCSKRLVLPTKLENSEYFQDAIEDIDISKSMRGKLFSA